MERVNNLIVVTSSLCPQCGNEIFGRIVEDAGQAVMVKRCLTHGQTQAVVESSAAFLRWVRLFPHKNLFVALFLDVTTRCNMRCHPCYFPVSNGTNDPPLSDLLDVTERSGFKSFVLTGGEPTLRADLPQLVSALIARGKFMTILTNGLALADADYLDALIAAFGETTGDLLPVSMSIHPEEASTSAQYATKMRALEQIRARGKRVETLSFTLHSLDQLFSVLSVIQAYRDVYWCARIRSASPLWASGSPPPRLFVSDLLQRMVDLAREQQAPISVKTDWDNNLYHLNLDYGGIYCRLISWPDVQTVDLAELCGCGPYALTRNGRLLNVAHAYLMNGFLSEYPTHKLQGDPNS